MRKTVAALAVAVAGALALALAGCGGGGGSEGGQGTTSAPAGTSTGQATGDFTMADAMFAQMMIPHHAQAVEMSEILLAKDGVDERVRTLAEAIKAAQAPEIEQMQGWLDEWGMPSMPGEMPMDHGDMGMEGMGMEGMGMEGMGMAGMLSAEELQALREAQGVEATRLYLEQMIVHHEGAVIMAQEEVEDGRNADAIALATTIIEVQQREIGQMRELLGSL